VIDATEVYRLTLALAGVGIAITTAEYWSSASSFGQSGVYSWRVLRVRSDVPDALGHAIAALPQVAAIRALCAVRVAALLVTLVSEPATPSFGLGVGALLGSDLVLWWRRTAFGADGSDQMTTLLLVTSFVCAGPFATPVTMAAGLVFIAAQGCLSYLAAGVAKLLSPTWRTGRAVGMIFSTGSYGEPRLAEMLDRFPWLSRVGSWSAMGMETLFPLCLVLPDPWRWIFLAWGASFHLQCAVVMGLNTFLWAFVATYPAILYAAGWLGH